MPRLGSETPRLLTEPARPLTRETSRGFEVIEFSEQFLGLTLLPWQRWWLIHALETKPDGNYRFNTVLTLVARQNGKTELLAAVITWTLFTGRARLVLGAAQNIQTAREAWEKVVAYGETDPDLFAAMGKPKRGGDTSLPLANGARYKISAASRSAGRGLSADLLVMDELREHKDFDAWNALSNTTMARPNALTLCITNAGDDRSVVLNQLRDTALTGSDPTLALFEWSAPDGAELDDPEAWGQANPGLGVTIQESRLRSAKETSTPAGFRTENLCQRVDSLDEAIDLAAWRACGDRAGSLDAARDRVVACLDVSPDLTHVTLSVAALLSDDRVRVETAGAWASTDEARADLPDLLVRIKPRAFGWFPGGPAAALAADLRAVRHAVELKAGDVPAVCQGFSEQISARRVVHADDPLLNSQASQTARLMAGDGWRFRRRGVGNVDAVYSAAGAVHLARTAPSLGKIRIVTAA